MDDSTASASTRNEQNAKRPKDRRRIRKTETQIERRRRQLRTRSVCTGRLGDASAYHHLHISSNRNGIYTLGRFTSIARATLSLDLFAIIMVHRRRVRLCRWRRMHGETFHVKHKNRFYFVSILALNAKAWARWAAQVEIIELCKSWFVVRWLPLICLFVWPSISVIVIQIFFTIYALANRQLRQCESTWKLIIFFYSTVNRSLQFAFFFFAKCHKSFSLSFFLCFGRLPTSIKFHIDLHKEPTRTLLVSCSCYSENMHRTTFTKSSSLSDKR